MGGDAKSTGFSARLPEEKSQSQNKKRNWSWIGKGSAQESRERGVAVARAFCRPSLEVFFSFLLVWVFFFLSFSFFLPPLSEVDVGLAKRKCLHFVTLSPDAPTFSPWQLSAPAAARSEGGREGTMSRGPGMCPQLLFTNTELFMTAGERNSTPAPSSQTSRAAGAWESRAPRLFLGRAVGKVSRAPGARRGCRARLRCGRGSLCLGDAEGAPASALLGPGDAAPPQFLQRRRSAPASQTSIPRFVYLRTRPRENSQFQRKRNPLRKLRFQTKADPAHNLKSPTSQWFLTFSLEIPHPGLKFVF